jgi:hypothetical protein|uniref:Uncharacterized protein n=1 Tax=viral metagenome TaxID=1070528 RepID=A0A6C0DBM7_9ZZZZ
MKKVDYTLALGIFAGLVVLYLLMANSVQGFQNAPSSSTATPSNAMPEPTTPSNDAQTASLMPPTTTPAAMNTATTTIKLSDLQMAKNAMNTLKATLDNLH